MLLKSPNAAARLERVSQWLCRRASAAPLLLVGARLEAVNDVARVPFAAATEARAGGGDGGGRAATFGWQRHTCATLAARLALPRLRPKGLLPASQLGLQAVCTRVIAELGSQKELGRIAAVADRPGLPRALGETLQQLGLAGVEPASLGAVDADLARLQDAYRRRLAEEGLADRALLFAEAVAVATSGDHPLLGLPAAWIDVAPDGPLEAELIGAVCRRSPCWIATIPAGDDASQQLLEQALGVAAEPLEQPGRTDLQRLQDRLFAPPEPPAEPPDRSVTLLTCPGESRECVEIARQLLREAREGTAFDCMAVLIHSPALYRPHLEEVFLRARIPAFYTEGTVLPDPSGRALLALLRCAAEGLPARRFAEYLSLGVVPDAPAGEPPAAPARPERWRPARDELSGRRDELDDPPEAVAEEPEAAAEAGGPVVAGTLLAPRRWERLLIDAAVSGGTAEAAGGAARWRRQLAQLKRGLEQQLQDGAALLDAGGEEWRQQATERKLADLEQLERFALPLVEALAALPERATYAEWLDELSALACRALREPGRVLEVLAELAPLCALGPVKLAEVELVLRRRLADMLHRPAGSRAGKVFVATPEHARGLSFAVVFVPGLAEKLFPHKVVEDPLLLDSLRRRLSPALITNEVRAARQRLALRLAVGAAGRRVFLSYPRLDVGRYRVRVPSFYCLEVLRAVTGRLPGFDELKRRAHRGAAERMGWPAPKNQSLAIDEAEYDLAMLQRALNGPPEQRQGAMRYLLNASEHLGRALRFRARRWLSRPRFCSADGLVKPSAAARQALEPFQLAVRPYSPTALERYAACPYRFFLAAVVRLSPREEPGYAEQIDPALRGRLVHQVQREVLVELQRATMLPLDAAAWQPAAALLDRCLDRVAADVRDRLAVVIDRIYEDEIEAIRADLREWLRRLAAQPEWLPRHFELGFGLAAAAGRDRASAPEPVQLDCGLTLRGSIDLVEERGAELRATDHKTGQAPDQRPALRIGGGQVLQPLLYAAALEKLFPGRIVTSGDLHYCTSQGGFQRLSVPLDQPARRQLELVAGTINHALEQAFLPAYPAAGQCEHCPYLSVCGPYEEERVARHRPELPRLELLRREP